MIRGLLVFVLLCVATPASAQWYEASSNNFLVYSQGSEQDARDYAAKLERFHYVLRTYHRVTAPAPPNRE